MENRHLSVMFASSARGGMGSCQSPSIIDEETESQGLKGGVSSRA